jgi:hypothetical protein
VSAGAELRVDTTDADVSVRAWDLNRIDARVMTTGWKVGPGEVQVRERQIGNHVDLDVRPPVRNWSIGSNKVRIELQVPRQTRTEVRSGDGQIHVEGIQGSTRLTTGDGAIETDLLDGALEARTGDGNIRARGRLDSLRLRTGDGSIQADILQGSKVTGMWRVESGDGRVRVRLAPDFAAQLDVRTGDGGISSDLPLTTTAVHTPSKLRGSLNNGSGIFSIRTRDGAIHIGSL